MHILIRQGGKPFSWMLEEHARLEAELRPLEPAPLHVSAPPADGLMTLKDAVALPELGGVVSIKSLRGAIQRGDIKAVQPGGPTGSIFVTRKALMSWIDKCHVAPSHPTSISGQPVTPAPSSGKGRSTSLSTDQRKAALAAALSSARKLKKP